MTRFITIDEVAGLVPDGATVVSDGMTLMGVADEVLAAIERSFLSTAQPRDLTWVHSAGQSNRVEGLARVAHEGLLRRVVGSHWGLNPPMAELLGDDKAEAVCLPQGQLSTLFRTIAAKRPGQLSTVGLGTYVDPRGDGGRINASAKANIAPDEYVELLELHGEEYLFYKSFKLDVAIIRGSAVDRLGNLSQREEVSGLDALAIAQAVHNSGGIVIAQVRDVVEPGEIDARDVTVPAVLVDYVVQTSDAAAHHRQSHTFPEFNADLITGYVSPENVGQAFEAQDMAEDRVAVGVRGVTLVQPGDVINVGTGIPADTIGRALTRANLLDKVHLTVESGTYGGIPLGVVDFGCSIHPQAIIGHPQQMDFYNGGGVDITFMGIGQFDGVGNVNVSFLGGKAIGCGGFMDIVDGARKLCFLMSASGKHTKFVEKVDQVSYNGRRALAKGQEVYLATQHYLLQLTGRGWVLLDRDEGPDADAALDAIKIALTEEVSA
ncbi:propionate CoA-transferase [Georgenia soli]|uniref:Propionate CoA-transferase n=1 Tax=Georgenia soli TaxID=638953 RepID=A0A2A9ELB1_9MICO|nr:CoA-transferase [Georgenia soli]PFG39052.1 propionate CoA-transferase [Georgenia soli]